ncbi:MAG TPA: BON domain-containing protein [Gemmatimonadaceae bacterium]|jgi:osmotically-inducible protein OsmY
MKSDTVLQKDVIDELRWDPRVKQKEIGVAARDGVVTITGSVESFAERWAVERAVERVAGVRVVANEIDVKLPSSLVRTDSDIAHQMRQAFKWDVQVPDELITAEVTKGWVTLEGEVGWNFQREAAAQAVRNLAGVRGVTNLIRVKSSISAYDVNLKIKDALRRRADRDAANIQVQANGDVVTLKGTVSSFAERRAAEGVAWSAPGVHEVKDELIVAM